MIKNKKLFFLQNPDFSDIFLILTNLITIIFAIVEKWDIKYVFWTFFIQNIIIGFFAYLKIISLKENKKKISINNKLSKSKYNIKLLSANIFMGAFLIFHISYFFIINIFIKDFQLDFKILNLIGILVLIFFINHLFSFFYNRRNDLEKRKSAIEILNNTFARLFGIHFILIISGILYSVSVKSNLKIPSLLYISGLIIIKIIMEFKIHKKEHHS